MPARAAVPWIVIASLAGPVWADSTPAGDAGLSVSVQAQQGRYLASERLGGVLLNQDAGELSGGQLGLRAVRTPVVLGLMLEQLQGGLAYSGYTQVGLPLQTDTALRWQRLQLSAGPAARLDTGLGSLGLSAGVAQLVVRRAIAATPRSLPVTETLRLGLLSAGGDWRLALPGAAQLQVGLQWHAALDTRLVVDSPGVFDRYSLAPQRSGWPALGLVLEWPLAPRWSLLASLHHEVLQLGSAPARPVYNQGRLAGVSSYPGSRQRLQRLGLGLQVAL